MNYDKLKGVNFGRLLTTPGQDVYSSADWELRTAQIKGDDGKIVFEQEGCEFPASWSQLATNVVVSKYFRGPYGSPERETSLRQVINRVVYSIVGYGRENAYFSSQESADCFSDELTHLLLHQYGSFNSPVWFNIGVKGSRQQASACFIQRVEDNLTSITDLIANEALLFKYGSGSGTNLSRIRAATERLALGGEASGPLSFMKALDSVAGSMKSGGTTRRAALMRCLDVTHPDIIDFIECKMIEERKAWALIEQGYDGGFNKPGGAYDSVTYQNANNSVRVSDEFMQAVKEKRTYQTKYVVSGEAAEYHRADFVMRKIAEGTHVCGDPGMQYDTTINNWHTCPNTDRIYGSNPCSEYMFLDDSACNLASLNLMKYRKPDGSFDPLLFAHACEVFITAQEILVSYSDYPTKAIAKNSEDFRPLGLGFANLGALLMAQGLAYDSGEGRAIAGAITAVMTGAAYAQSARIARAKGAFNGYSLNREPMLNVMKMHRDQLIYIDATLVHSELFRYACNVWQVCVALGEKYGYRNSQATVLAPTGTIAFMMDCDTTGIEPAISLVSYKTLVGGGSLKLVNQTVPEALRKLGYSEFTIKEIVDYIAEMDTIEGYYIDEEHLPVFDCAFKAAQGTRSISWEGHVKMMAACQPFISGAISKTVNLPNDCTVEDIERAYIMAHDLGVKAVAVYRDGSKRTQPLNTSKAAIIKEAQEIIDEQDKIITELVELPLVASGSSWGEARHDPLEKVLDAQKKLLQAEAVGIDIDAEIRQRVIHGQHPLRRPLPDERAAVNHKFNVAGHKGYLNVGMYDDGSLGEIFINMNKEGSTLSGMMDAFSIAVSVGLQYGVPLSVLVEKFRHTRFEPHGFTKNPDIRTASSIIDYIFQWLERRFLGKKVTTQEDFEDSLVEVDQLVTKFVVKGNKQIEHDLGGAMFDPKDVGGNGVMDTLKITSGQMDAPPCQNCGTMMTRAGSCYRCTNCGNTTGCG